MERADTRADHTGENTGDPRQKMREISSNRERCETRIECEFSMLIYSRSTQRK